METIIVAAIGSTATVIVALINRSSASKEHPRVEKNPISIPTMSILSLGASLTTLAVIIAILIFPLSRVEKLSVEPPPLSKFLDTPVIPEIERIKKIDADAKALLEGAGPKELTVDGRVWKTGDVLYVPGWQWVDNVFPLSKRHDMAKCGIQAGGKITIIGFSLDSKSVLFRYEALGDTNGTPCDNGVYFFHLYEKA